MVDLRDTMQALNGAGLAAPQIGVALRVVIFGVEHNSRYPDAESVPETVLINPIITPVSHDMEEGWEGCLSVPGLRGAVQRYSMIRYQGFDQYGSPIERLAEGFHARVVQHDFHMALTDEQPIGRSLVTTPFAQSAGKKPGLIDVYDRLAARIPFGTKNLDDDAMVAWDMTHLTN